MPEFSDRVGVRFLEVMSGRVRGDVEAVRADDPGDEIGLFDYNLEIRIPSLRAFLDADEHVAEIASGDVQWQPFVGRTPIIPGRCVLYRPEAGTRRRKYFDFEYAFPSGMGYDIEVEGHKILRDDAGLDVIADMSTVHLTFRAQGNIIARGVVTVHIAEALRQLKSIEITGAESKEEAKRAEQAFFAWMNGEIREVYRDFPLLLKDEDRLSLEERRTLELCIRVMLPDPLPPDGPTRDDIIESLEKFLRIASAREIEDARNGLQAVGVFLSIFGSNVKDIRKAIARELRNKNRTPIRDVLSFVHSLVVLPYYAHPKVDALVGYRRPVHIPRHNRELPVQAEPPNRTFDVAIAGSGPAGSILAARLARAGRSVLLLEAGPYVPEKDITSDELMAIARLYKESGLQRANVPLGIFDEMLPTFFVLQGFCVGGGGVINNAVCFRLPPARLQRWQSAGFPLSQAELDAGYAALATELPIVPASDATPDLNPGSRLLQAAFGPPRKPSLVEPPTPGFYECLVNLEPQGPDGAGCIGTGLCNVGCGSERKRNSYQVHLADAAANGCVIVPEAKAVDVRLANGAAGGERMVEGLVVRLRDGRKVTVRAREVVLSCGPIGSTEVLLRSDHVNDHARARGLPVGRRFSANLGSPLFVFTNTDMHTRASLQIAHYYMPPGQDDGFVIETWYNPPAANAVGMPGYMQEHFDRMRRYRQSLAAAPLVGSDPVGRIRIKDRRLRVELPFGEPEIERLAEGLSLLARAFLESGEVEYALAGFENGRVMKNEDDVEKFRKNLLSIRKSRSKLHRLRIGTGHPMGGNAMSEDPNIGVVDARFRVRGIANLRVCDGSIFPDSSGVNPQWTIMALADRCARVIDDSLG